MRRLVVSAAGALLLALLPLSVLGQTHTFSGDEYTLELPSATWRATSRTDSVHQHTEFIYGDRLDGHLRIRKEVVDAGTTPSDLATRDQDNLRFSRPGYVEGKQERFAGRLSGVTTGYEYTSGGKAMVGRIYYLQADNRTIYALHFTGQRDKLLRIRNQTDAIARTFHLK